ncbi:unnamed protein product [Lactuca saligna]|uniref:SHSP domain-containing protein n=1 Tax=Lactuca saligna TaxID=75948 RepID=A0AA35V0T1_LACSI|nr:unnamed protein product [Lactuca saligna]
MEAKGITTPAARVYQDFEPSMEWVPEDDSDTLLVYLPGFAKEQLRVQLRSRNLNISGERKLQQDTWSRFRVEFPVSANCDLNKISAKFEGNILFVRQPKLITPEAKPVEETPPAVAAAPVPTPQKPVDVPNVGQKTTNENPTPATQTNTENSLRKDQEVPKMGVEESSKKPEEKPSEPKKAKGVREHASEKKPSDSNRKKKTKVALGELDKTTKTAIENYKRAVGVFATKLKTSRNAVNTIVILLVGLVIGVYVSGSIKSWTKP